MRGRSRNRVARALTAVASAVAVGALGLGVAHADEPQDLGAGAEPDSLTVEPDVVDPDLLTVEPEVVEPEAAWAAEDEGATVEAPATETLGFIPGEWNITAAWQPSSVHVDCGIGEAASKVVGTVGHHPVNGTILTASLRYWRVGDGPSAASPVDLTVQSGASFDVLVTGLLPGSYEGTIGLYADGELVAQGDVGTLLVTDEQCTAPVLGAFFEPAVVEVCEGDTGASVLHGTVTGLEQG